MAGMLAVSVVTKTYVSLGLVFLAIFEFWTAMYVYGSKGRKRFGSLALRLHRFGGYVFLLYWLWPMYVGLDLLGRLSRHSAELPEGLKWQFDGPRSFHAILAVAVLLLLLLKIAFVRLFPTYRQQARLLGVIVTIASITVWVISGLFWLAMMGTPVLER